MMLPTPIVVCRVCGHEEPEGSITRYAPLEDEDEAVRAERIARYRAELRVQRWYEDKLTLRAVTFPIYAAEDWPAQIRGSGSRNDELTELTIAHTAYRLGSRDMSVRRCRMPSTSSSTAATCASSSAQDKLTKPYRASSREGRSSRGPHP
jgi:hypothetical protein